MKCVSQHQDLQIAVLKLNTYPENTKHLYNICTMLDRRQDVEPTLHKCYTNVLYLLG